MAVAVEGHVHSSSRRGHRRTGVIAIVVVLAVAGGIVAHHAWSAGLDRAPYAAAAINAHLTMQLVDGAQAQGRIDELAGPGRLTAMVPPGPGEYPQQRLIGQLNFDVPTNAPSRGHYAMFVIDERLGNPAPGIWAIGPDGSNVGQGWDGRYDKVAKQVPWLNALASRYTEGRGWVAPGMAVSFPADTPGPITFEATFDRDAIYLTDPEGQLTVALVFLGERGTVYWAERLSG